MALKSNFAAGMNNSEKSQMTKSLIVLVAAIIGMAVVSYIVFYQISKAAIKQNSDVSLILDWAESVGIDKITLNQLVNELTQKDLEHAVISSKTDSVAETSADIFWDSLNLNKDLKTDLRNKIEVNNTIYIRDQVYNNINVLPLMYPIIKKELIKSLNDK